MKIRFKTTLIKRNKKHDYKIFEDESFSNIFGYQQSYTIYNYNETELIESHIPEWGMVMDKIKSLESEVK